MKKIIRATFNNQTRVLDKSGFAAAMLMFRNTPRSPTDLSPAQLVFGRHLQDTLPFSRQMLRPQCRFEIEKRRLEVREGQRQENDSSKRRKLPLLRPAQRIRFQDPITKRWTLTGKVPYILAYKSRNFGQKLNILLSIRLICGSTKFIYFYFTRVECEWSFFNINMVYQFLITESN